MLYANYLNIYFFVLLHGKTAIHFYQRGHMMLLPPSTGRVTPVMNEASSEARKPIALATSSVVPSI